MHNMGTADTGPGGWPKKPARPTRPMTPRKIRHFHRRASSNKPRVTPTGSQISSARRARHNSPRYCLRNRQTTVPQQSHRNGADSTPRRRKYSPHCSQLPCVERLDLVLHSLGCCCLGFCCGCSGCCCCYYRRRRRCCCHCSCCDCGRHPLAPEGTAHWRRMGLCSVLPPPSPGSTRGGRGGGGLELLNTGRFSPTLSPPTPGPARGRRGGGGLLDRDYFSSELSPPSPGPARGGRGGEGLRDLDCSSAP